MPLSGLLAGVEAVAFDAYGTLFDVHAAVARHAAAVGPEAARLSEIWRLKQLEYSWVLSLMGRYEPFWTLTQRALDHALSRCPGVDRGLRGRLLDAYLALDAYPEARDALAALRERSLRTAILSNGSPEMLDSAVASAGLQGLLDAVLSVDAVRTFKTSPRAYALVTAAFDLAPGKVAFVSSNRWDVAGAAAFGFRCIWVNRAGLPDEYEDLSPAATVGSLAGLL
ncbi:MAG TPA: haloacid dehalogenase type II [Beijerinckiaceae bacterium]|jgi:2-haloacid dehalogenase